MLNLSKLNYFFLQNVPSTTQRRPSVFKPGRVCLHSLSDGGQRWPLPTPINAVVLGTGLRAQELKGVLWNCHLPEVKTGIPRDVVYEVGVGGAGEKRETPLLPS